jgi:mannose-6-phosphate isomerase-like protein (cupin superfamily)
MNVNDLIRDQAENGETWLEFFRVPALSLGLYVVPAGGVDEQTPHAEDEIYLVVEGRGVLAVEGIDRPVGPGDLLFVAARDDHRFHSITEDLKLLVVFAPAETT